MPTLLCLSSRTIAVVPSFACHDIKCSFFLPSLNFSNPQGIGPPFTMRYDRISYLFFVLVVLLKEGGREKYIPYVVVVLFGRIFSRVLTFLVTFLLLFSMSRYFFLKQPDPLQPFFILPELGTNWPLRTMKRESVFCLLRY